MRRNGSTVDATYAWHYEPSPSHVKSEIARIAGDMLLVLKDEDAKIEHK